VVEADGAATALGAQPPAARTGLKNAPTRRLRLPGLVEPAGRLHDQERAGEAGATDVPIDLADIAAHLRPDIGIGDNGRAPLELAVLLRELVRGGDEHGRVPRFEDRLGARLVV